MCGSFGSLALVGLQHSVLNISLAFSTLLKDFQVSVCDSEERYAELQCLSSTILWVCSFWRSIQENTSD